MRVNTENFLRNISIALAFVLVLAALTFGLGFFQKNTIFPKPEKRIEAVEATRIIEIAEVNETAEPTKIVEENKLAKVTETAKPKFSIASLFQRSTPTPTSEPSAPTETPTVVPTTFVPPVSIRIPASSGAGGASPICKLPLDVVVFVDYNRDDIGVTAEMVTGLQINLYDASYNRLGTTYTNNGKASFCLPSKGIYYLDMPYIQTTREFRNDSVSTNNLVTIKLVAPEIPIRLP